MNKLAKTFDTFNQSVNELSRLSEWSVDPKTT